MHTSTRATLPPSARARDGSPPSTTPPAANACAESVAAFDAAAKAVQAIVKYGTLAAGGAPVGARGALKAMGLDFGALDAEPCALQVVLLPFGAGKADLDEYKR